MYAEMSKYPSTLIVFTPENESRSNSRISIAANVNPEYSEIMHIVCEGPLLLSIQLVG